MRRNVLITGSAPVLGSHLAARRLTTSDDMVFYAAHEYQVPPREELASLIEHAARRFAGVEETAPLGESAGARLAWISLKPSAVSCSLADALPEGARLDEVWFLSGGALPAPWPAAGSDAETARALLAALPALGTAELNYVTVDGATPGGSRDSSRESGDESADTSSGVEREVIGRCETSGVGYRIFRAARVLGEIPPSSARGYEGFFRFLAALHELKGEVEERVPEYFEYQALRCLAPAGSAMNLVRAERAAELMARLAARRDTLGGAYSIAAPDDTPFAEVCARAGFAYDLSLLAVEDAGEMNAVDRLFQSRLGGLDASPAPPSDARDDAYRLAGLASESARLDEDEQTELMRAVRHSQDAARAARAESVAAMRASLERTAIERGGSELIYHWLGAGETPVVLLNALGQGLHYWHRLMERLSRRRRVIIWEPRGTDESSGEFRLAEQVEDLEAVLRREGARSCHLVGWCTGPKVAVDFYLRRPEAVAAMVFLNGTFKSAAGLDEIETPYEHHLEQLCRAVERRPALAPSLMSSLRASAAGEGVDLLEESDPEELAAGVLSAMNADLREDVLHPFRGEPVLINYARQLLDFWSRDTLADAGRVRAPVLLVGSEYDKIAGAEMSREAARRFPRARLVELQGATHYCLYDSPDLICELIERFLREADEARGAGGEVFDESEAVGSAERLRA